MSFEPDDALKNYATAYRMDFGTDEIETSSSKVRVGYFDLLIDVVDPEYPDTITLGFDAVTTRMSLLLEESASVQRFFADLCVKIEADSCYLNMEHNGEKLIFQR